MQGDVRDSEKARGIEVGNDTKKMNVGLNLLRIVLTFGVVLDHFWWTATPEKYTGIDTALWNLRTLAVPAFMTMTFFLTARRFWGGDVPWLKKRYLRLYEPFVFWAIVYWFVRLAASHFDSWYAVSVKDLLWQLALGSARYAGQFWFHADLIILTGLFFVAFRIVRSPKANLWFGLGSVALGLTMQYTQLHLAIFGGLPHEARIPLGRLASMLPYAGVGFLLASVRERIDSIPGNVKLAVSLFGLWLAWFVVYEPVCPRPDTTIGYEGFKLNLTAWGFMVAFYYMPFDRLPAFVSKAVLSVSRYCMGVYCVHFLFGQMMFDFVFHGTKTATDFGNLRIFSIAQCLVVWVLSYLICWLVSLIPVAFCKRVVE